MKFIISLLVLCTAISASATSLKPAYLYASESQNTMGLSLVRASVTDDLRQGVQKNMMLSPISARMAFSMALNGAGGHTQDQLADFMAVKNSSNLWDLNFVNFSNLDLATLIQKDLPEEVSDRYSRPVEMKTYNSAWSTNGATDGRLFQFSPSYLGTLEKFYQAEVQSLDFKQPAAADAINAWVNEKTKQMIPQIIDSETLTDMLWVLLNATYFEGGWGVEFKELSKENTPLFTKLDGSSQEMAAIEVEGRLDYVESNSYKATKVPFSDRNYTFYVILPDQDIDFYEMQTDASNGVWSDAFWEDLRISFNSEEATQHQVRLQLPKFAFDYGIEMLEDSDLTADLGLSSIFSNQADFFPMATPESLASKVGIIKQDTRIELDESGVKAAAVTLIGGMERAYMPPVPTAELIVDRPFYFAIVNESTQALLFVGSVVDPEYDVEKN